MACSLPAGRLVRPDDQRLACHVSNLGPRARPETVTLDTRDRRPQDLRRVLRRSVASPRRPVEFEADPDAEAVCAEVAGCNRVRAYPSSLFTYRRSAEAPGDARSAEHLVFRPANRVSRARNRHTEGRCDGPTYGGDSRDHHRRCTQSPDEGTHGAQGACQSDIEALRVPYQIWQYVSRHSTSSSSRRAVVLVASSTRQQPSY